MQSEQFKDSQVVRFSKLTSIRVSLLRNILPENKLASQNDNDQLSCLLLSTDKSFQIWLLCLNPTSLFDPSRTITQFKKECLYSKSLPEVSFFDFLHCQSFIKVDKSISDKKLGTSDVGPLVGYVSFNSRCQLNIFSLAKE